jgi:hypothetical protein
MLSRLNMGTGMGNRTVSVCSLRSAHFAKFISGSSGSAASGVALPKIAANARSISNSAPGLGLGDLLAAERYRYRLSFLVGSARL